MNKISHENSFFIFIKLEILHMQTFIAVNTTYDLWFRYAFEAFCSLESVI